MRPSQGLVRERARNERRAVSRPAASLRPRDLPSADTILMGFRRCAGHVIGKLHQFPELGRLSGQTDRDVLAEALAFFKPAIPLVEPRHRCLVEAELVPAIGHTPQGMSARVKSPPPR